MNPGASYSKKIKVQIFECDLAGRLRLSYLMRHIQQLGEDQLEALGIGYQKTLQEHSMVFLLTRIVLEVERMPTVYEELTFTTRPLEPVKAQFFRETAVSDAEGNRLVTAWSAWLLFDPSARRVLRPGKFPYPLDCGPAPDQQRFELALPEGSPAGRHTVGFSQVDINRHLTNSAYSDIIYDCLPWQMAEEGRLASVSIHFQSEAKPGEEIALFTHIEDGNSCTVYGTVEQSPCFGARLTFHTAG